MSVKNWQTIVVALLDGAMTGAVTALATVSTTGTMQWKVIAAGALAGAITSARRFVQSPDTPPSIT